MEIGVTEATRKFLGWKPLPAAEETDPFFCWDLVRADYGQRKLLVMSNAATRLCAVSRMSGSDWKKLETIVPELIASAIATAYSSMPIMLLDQQQTRVGFRLMRPEEDADAYLELAGPIRFTKTHGAKPVSGLTDTTFRIAVDWLNMDAKFQQAETGRLNDTLCHVPGVKDFIHPAELFAQTLALYPSLDF